MLFVQPVFYTMNGNLYDRGDNMIIHILLCTLGSVSIGYAVHVLLYWREMHALVGLDDDVCSGVDLIICLAVAGLLISFF